jgi:hypothetical protein
MVRSYWVTGGMGDPIGFDLDKAAAHLERLGLPPSKATLVKLQTISEAALAGIAERRTAQRQAAEAEQRSRAARHG